MKEQSFTRLRPFSRNKGSAKIFLLLLSSLFIVLGFLPESLFSQASDNATLSLTAYVSARCKIEVNTSIISFTRSTWTGQPQTIAANEGPFTLTIKMTSNSGSTVNVWLVASSDLKGASTGYTIPIGTISWTAQGAGFCAGQLNNASPVLAARLSGSGIFKGSLNFSFADDPKNFAPGNYQATVTILVTGI